MNPEAFALGEHLLVRYLTYYPYADHWDRYNLEGLNLSFPNWTTIKYLNDAGDGFGTAINELPNDEGGLYLFTVRCPVIDGVTTYPVYVGRALITEHQSLRARCRTYFNEYQNGTDRPKIHRMFNYWKKELYLSFIRVGDNVVTIDFEKKLINSLLLPCNSFIPDVEVRQAVNAFTL